MTSFRDLAAQKPVVVASLEDAEGFRCVDVVLRPGGDYTFNEYRRDPEDAGRWTLTGDHSHKAFASKDAALAAAASCIGWFAERLKRSDR